MMYLKIHASTGGWGVGVWMPEIAALEEKWEGQLNEVVDIIYGMAVFTEGR